MKKHELKTWHDAFEAVMRGDKPFEVRRNDRGFEVGDTLVLHEWVPEDPEACRWDAVGLKGMYTGRSLERMVTYVMRGQYGLPEDVVVMGLGHRAEDPHVSVGAVLCVPHNVWYMPKEGCAWCNPSPPDPEADARIMAALRRAPVAKMSDVQRALLLAQMAASKRDPRPGCTSGVMEALIGRMKETAQRYAKDTTEIRERAIALGDGDRAICDMLIGAANAIDDLNRDRRRLVAVAGAWREFADALHKNDTQRLAAAGETIAKYRPHKLAEPIGEPDDRKP